MNVENKCQQEARQIMQELESVSLDLGLKARIIDSIREMREELEEPCSEPEWKKKIMEADELVSYIAQKAGMSEKQISIDDSVSVTEEEVMEKILEILNRCYEDSGLQNDGYERGYREHTERAERDMREMTNTEANFKEASSVSAFCDYFKNVAKRYENRMNEEAERYAQELCDGYQGAMKDQQDDFRPQTWRPWNHKSADLQAVGCKYGRRGAEHKKRGGESGERRRFNRRIWRKECRGGSEDHPKK